MLGGPTCGKQLFGKLSLRLMLSGMLNLINITVKTAGRKEKARMTWRWWSQDLSLRQHTTLYETRLPLSNYPESSLRERDRTRGWGFHVCLTVDHKERLILSLSLPLFLFLLIVFWESFFLLFLYIENVSPPTYYCIFNTIVFPTYLLKRKIYWGCGGRVSCRGVRHVLFI